VAKYVLKDARILFGGYDLSGSSSAIALETMAALKPTTTFTSGGAEEHVPGLVSVKASASGYRDSASGEDTAIYSSIGGTNAPLTAWGTALAAGSNTYFFNALAGTYTPLEGEVGEVARFKFDAQGKDSPLIRGTVFEAGSTARTATGTSSIIQLGATSATQKLYTALHVTAASGTTPSLTVTVKSAALVGFGSPTTRATYAAKTAVGAEWVTPVAGAITDQFYRVDWTISGTTPSFNFVVVVGIL